MGKRPSPLSSELELELRKYEDAHKMASESNLTLHNAIKVHMDNLALLRKPLDELQREIPSMADLDDESETNIAEVRRILAKVDEMRAQRAKLAEDLRAETHGDDITAKLMAQQQGPNSTQLYLLEFLHDKLFDFWAFCHMILFT